VPIATSTAIAEWTDRALDSQHLNLREERVAVRKAQARVAEDSRQRSVDGPELSTMTGNTLRAFARAESMARGFQDGLKLLSLVTFGIGLSLSVLRACNPRWCGRAGSAWGFDPQTRRPRADAGMTGTMPTPSPESPSNG
jgi:hypothetical protein